MKLTSEQQKIVSDNHNLIYWYINMRHLDLDEWYDLIAIELCTSVAQWDPERGSLTTFFKRNCDTRVWKEYHKSQSQKNAHNGHVEIQPYHNHDKDEDDLAVLLDIDALFDGEFGHILRLKAEGYTQTEIADMVGVTQSYVSRVISKVRKEYYANN